MFTEQVMLHRKAQSSALTMPNPASLDIFSTLGSLMIGWNTEFFLEIPFNLIMK